MTRYIDADELKDWSEIIPLTDDGGIDINDFEEKLRTMPTIDALPVRHGKWTVEWETEDTRMLRCSECRMVFNVGKGRDGNYCPNCGARMDEDHARVHY